MPESTCTIERKCSSAGKLCSSEDRACQSKAIADGLEITCEQRTVEPRNYVYCPPGAQQRDSTVVWILLVVAVLVAMIGGLLSFVLLRKRLATPIKDQR
jgi:hypothetical protein